MVLISFMPKFIYRQVQNIELKIMELEHEDPYVFDPTINTITSKLPKAAVFLPLASRPNEGDKKYILGDRSQVMRCPACHFTDTKFKCLQKRDKAFGGGIGEPAGRFRCNTEEIALLPVPCIKCPLCKENETLMGLIVHRCEKHGLADIPVRPGKACVECDWSPNACCKCLLCNVTAHAKEFFVIANKVPCNIPDGIDVWPDYPANAIDDNVYDNIKRNAYIKKDEDARQLAASVGTKPTFAKACSYTAAALTHILAEPGGLTFLAELEESNVGIMQALGADTTTIAKMSVEKKPGVIFMIVLISMVSMAASSSLLAMAKETQFLTAWENRSW